MSSIARNPVVVRPVDLALIGRTLAGVMVFFFATHVALILAAGPAAVAASRYCTAALVVAAAGCAVWRAILLPRRERPPWLWAALGMLLWAAAHALEASVGHSVGGSVLTVDATDFVYVGAIFPLLLAFSTTRETQAIRPLYLLNFAQVLLALVLAWVLLYRTVFSPAVEAAIMGRVYGSACILLALMGLLRLFCWATPEERQCFRTINLFLWTYLPVELGMDYLTQHRGMTAGTLLDLAWSIPFGLAGWNALTLPLGKGDDSAALLRTRALLMVEGLCPILMSIAVFVLAAAVMPQHIVLGLFAMLFLLVTQGLQAAVVQTNYVLSRSALLDREQKLRNANIALEQLTLLDPLTGISNRRGFDAAFDAAWRRAVRRRYPLALLLVDVDYFKAVNDEHGHPYGDKCLKRLARVLDAAARRPDDLVARLGGEEFILILPEATADYAVDVARRVHESVRKLALVNSASPYGRLLTVSIGIAFCTPSPDDKPAAIFEAADQALYTAKDQGRNRTYSVLFRPQGNEAAVPRPAESPSASNPI